MSTIKVNGLQVIAVYFSEIEKSKSFYCEESGFPSAFLNLKNSGVEMVSEYIEYAPTFAMFRIVEPDGNVLEFAGEP
ncbi:MAG: hypothetical protein ABIG42_09150 [bacterium]